MKIQHFTSIKKARIITCTILLVIILTTSVIFAEQTTKEKSEAFIPSTISYEAKAFLQKLKPVEVKFSTKEEWKKSFLELNEKMTESNEGAKKKFPGDIKTIEIAGYKHLVITPESYDPINEKRLIIYVHGGGYTYFTAETTLISSLQAAHYARTKVLSVNYPLAWEKPYPACRDMVVSVYREMLKKHNSRFIAIYGDSAGGGTVMSAVLKIRDEGLPMPAVLGLLSPWADLTDTGDSQTTLEGYDPVLDYKMNLEASAKLYAGEKDLDDPGVSPLYADFTKGFPPSYISTGTRDLFLSHCSRLQRKLTDAGVENRLYLYEGMWHVFQLYPIPEAEAAWRDMALFFDRHLAR